VFIHFLQTSKQHWKLSLFVLLFLPILLSLGKWQLDRANEKRQILTVYQQQRELPALPLQDLADDKNSDYRSVIVKGVFDRERYWLLDNRSRGGVVGYEVLMPIIKDDGTAVLVNRGWVEAPPRRERLPDIDTPRGEISVTGYLFVAERNPMIKSSLSDLGVTWPKRVLQLDQTTAEKALELSVYPQTLRLDANSFGALVANWPVINVLPEKHLGYAFQWFSMAVALIILYLWFLFKERNVKKV
jgi:cytochrome oxidase assembly protein ShyY1